MLTEGFGIACRGLQQRKARRVQPSSSAGLYQGAAG
jgi:hypothetical protein